MAFDRERIKRKAAALAANGVFVGTSSWKYPGWRGMLYDEARYIYRGKFNETRLEKNCLSEYAEVFKTTCFDGAYYRFPNQKILESLFSQVPKDFQFAFKVTGEITIKKFPQHPRHGIRAGKINEHFLNPKLFADAFLLPCEPFRHQIGLLMFEFSRFYPSDYEHGREFVADLDKFLAALPADWPYAVEMRNYKWLQPDYFACLARRGVTHVFNSWDAMPSVSEQMALPGSRTNPKLAAARFLLKPGRNYEEAVKTFRPYDKVKEPYPEARESAKALIAAGKTTEPDRKTFICVNNRLEGNALETISAMVSDDK
jgi:uncharacterized protein YecE (DUF72 family)